MPKSVAFQRGFTRAVDHIIALRQPGVLLVPLPAKVFRGIFSAFMVAVPMSAVLDSTIETKEQDAFGA
ncbi:hypothetical protein D3C81_1821900 [compost metagenome]